ncbi:hypothetical protein [Xanthomonas hortorum]|nr:hypothetical protein [Xanthomonas hortorum]MCM5548234.1 hypothetical protein [Xanthomonas hortorum pv. pelargonii]
MKHLVRHAFDRFFRKQPPCAKRSFANTARLPALTCAASALLWVTAVMAAPSTPGLNLVLQPAAADAQGAVPSIDVALEIDALAVKKGATLLQINLMDSATVTSAKQIHDLQVEDAKGALRLTAQDETLTSSEQIRRWHADRDVQGAVKLRYRVAIDPGSPLNGTPMFEVRTGEGAVSGAGLAFLLLPDDSVERMLRVRWRLPAGEQGQALSSLGVGDVDSPRPLTVDEVRHLYFMQGKLGVFQAKDGGFVGAWTGTPLFPAERVMRWTETLHTYYMTFFHSDAARFVVLTRANPHNPGSGIGLTDSFAFTYGPATTEEGIQLLLAHEMFHAFMVDMPANEAARQSTAWFSEGLAIYYQRMLPLRAGLIDRAMFLHDLNRSAAQYYTNSARHGTNVEVFDKFWTDARFRLLPYNRGSMYFAQLDAAIRAHSAGKRSLDDLVLAVIAEHRAGRPVDEALWRKLLLAEAGRQAVADYQAMQMGKLVLPPSNAFGPCFRRVLRKTRPFDPGVAMSTFASPKKVVGLIAGSEADKAGLRNGDTVLKGGPGDALLNDPGQTMTLTIRRGAQTFDVTYLPRGAPVDTYQWEQAGAPQCDQTP